MGAIEKIRPETMAAYRRMARLKAAVDTSLDPEIIVDLVVFEQASPTLRKHIEQEGREP